MSADEQQQDPVYQGHRLRKRLRAAREQAGLTHLDVAERLEWSPSKINRIETGKVGLSITDARVLMDLYGISDPAEVEEITELARAARRPPWWAPYRNAAPPEFMRHLSYESSAIRISAFQCTVIPGLLQTEEYAKVVLRDSSDPVNQLELRLQRQERIVHRGGPRLNFILDEAAIRRVVGGEQTMKQQLEKLLTVNELPNVQIKVVPFTAGLYPQFRSPYVLFEFAEEDEDLIAYLEKPDGQVFLSERSPYAGIKGPDPSDYLDDFWTVNRNFAEDITPELLFGNVA
ncbi:helix-turn-helix transcriptional regulator [Streptomyces sp. UH6]|uniref:helix-turn-helix domain-containing protein n=1 Tax=Streptomyces sp. UH6 TaxID=2748379 RepID=UPI0015D491BC|nr:helix-turn-helix transcriptional regulator [Streptomyces sp. UH6]NYV73675.1 helix-turn-helix domain-containing protein [Streptomyces sp. UH6]